VTKERPKPLPPFFERALRAFKLAVPFALAVRTDRFDRCIETSLAGAKALRDRTIDARAIPCAVVGANMTLNPPVQLSLGLSAHEVYKRINWGADPPMPYEQWQQVAQVPEKLDRERSTHMAIDAQFDGVRAIVDPTIGQLRANGQIQIAMVEFFPCEPDEWPAFATRDGWELQYVDSPHTEEIQKLADGVLNYDGMVGDLDDLMQLALDVKLDDDRFFAVLKKQEPEKFKVAIARLSKLAR
jgi:hypothetical protein